ncbi:MAG: gluconolactonase [Pseudoalteromonas sp.]|uniref:SMP-30/gluconolactonase/LRE family protein n=1 Tax=unclassified Pseudoalteromonas TaxID=194690 RepID=UPI000C9084E8|nr:MULTISPECIES: SMP-30/gluconolactonase/LRE family protein [unclassified Pseudoalteromonas]MAD04193.1 gluconolactonase [Pseudoalteromonas sp.]MCP4585380.1 SMP-30/gluconolactonase/LRE family protein [Pseudoalteromonas sp.]URQ92803.1 SMP-30/gluconolactonase/LRE family protein [Pseudoalteromonas sp. SCSIO 43101]|tara:strand:- start:20828 stop:21670 length:843 start_codon:yes stop_codon:yes gene_type:complete
MKLLKPLAITLLLSSPLTFAVDSQDFVKDNVFTQGVEGPTMHNGALYAVNYAQQGTIGRVDNMGKTSLFVRLPNDSIGNGLQFDSHGNLFIADYVNHNILKVPAGSNKAEVFAHNSNMNQPNDIAITKTGVLFASDPNWANETGQLWRINADGSTKLLEENMGTTNGIAVNKENTKLYVNESVQRVVWQYDLDESLNISNKKVLIKFTDHGLDGMRVNNQGHVFITRYGAGKVLEVSPSGKVLNSYKLKGQHPTNLAFDDMQSRVYVTMQKRGAIEVIEL